MYQGLKYKFTQNDSLKKILLGTGDAHIVEEAKDDSYWGSGPDN